MNGSMKYNESLTNGVVVFFKAALKTFQDPLLIPSILQTTTGQIQGSSVLERCILQTGLLILTYPQCQVCKSEDALVKQ